jgi:hypothetical protein
LGDRQVLLFLGPALLVPLLVLVFNAFIRWLFRLEPSSFTDVILMFVVFDVLVIVEHSHVAQYLQSEILRNDLELIYSGLLITNMFLWILATFRIERRLSDAYDHYTKRYVSLPWTDLAQSWGLSLIVFFSNLASFAYRK